MKKIPVFFAGIIFLSALLTITAFKSAPPGPSINGQGTLNAAYLNGTQHFSFHASKNSAGNVSGTFESKSPGQEIRVHGNIDCFNILADGKTAYVSGVVTEVVGEGYPIAVGNHIWFKIQDNGEGANAAADKFSDYFVFGVCQNLNVGLQDITGGNIQVKP